jgi:hypothetical protein
MQPAKWYEIQIYPTANPTMPSNKLIQLLAISDYNSNYLIYDSNLAFAYINIEAALSGPNSLQIICNSSSSEQSRTSSIYNLDIYIQSTIASTSGGNFTLSIYYDSGVPAHVNSGTTDLDFSFMGLCQSQSTYSQPAAILNFCQISSDLSTITFSVNSITVG